MQDTAELENIQRQKIAQATAAATQTPVEDVTPPAEGPLKLAGEAADVVNNFAEDVGRDLFGGSTVEVEPSHTLLDMLKAKVKGEQKKAA